MSILDWFPSSRKEMLYVACYFCYSRILCPRWDLFEQIVCLIYKVNLLVYHSHVSLQFNANLMILLFLCNVSMRNFVKLEHGTRSRTDLSTWKWKMKGRKLTHDCTSYGLRSKSRIIICPTDLVRLHKNGILTTMPPHLQRALEFFTVTKLSQTWTAALDWVI